MGIIVYIPLFMGNAEPKPETLNPKPLSSTVVVLQTLQDPTGPSQTCSAQPETIN